MEDQSLADPREQKKTIRSNSSLKLGCISSICAVASSLFGLTTQSYLSQYEPLASQVISILVGLVAIVAGGKGLSQSRKETKAFLARALCIFGIGFALLQIAYGHM